jgi:hypothetical protein
MPAALGMASAFFNGGNIGARRLKSGFSSCPLRWRTVRMSLLGQYVPVCDKGISPDEIPLAWGDVRNLNATYSIGMATR